jgi:exodeoxyribonuclease VII small subunit
MENPNDDQPSESELSFEDALVALEAAVHDLEDGRLGLSESLARYEESVRHLKRCYQLLEAAEKKVELLTGVADDGTPLTQPFAESGEADEKSVGRKRRARPAASGSSGEASPHDIDAQADRT